MDDWQARLMLSMCVEPGNEKVGSLVAEFGAVVATDHLLEGDSFPQISKRLRTFVTTQKFTQIVDHANQVNARFITPDSDEWPVLLDDLDVARPFGLWCRGTRMLDQYLDSAISVVGARASTSYGERMASELGALAAKQGVSTVSGAAYGIDAAAHRGSLAADGATIAVLACGVDVSYPSAHQALLSRIMENGCIISEIPLGQSAHKRHFLIRNRIIAALSQTTVVVEAALRSGSLSTANWAYNLGRQVWGVPGPLTSASSAGVHAGIRDGVISLVADLAEVVPKQKTPNNPVLQGDVHSHIIEVLGKSPHAVGLEVSEILAVMVSAGYSTQEVLATLSVLEINGHVIRTNGGWALA